ncbi:protein of unknown function [Trichlorobacter ammonificans]|uniref:Uncharacterized protein n=1 Tax=Trichlorobacter ammonificans TaxID=2916410 RepID=A0ABM9DBH0_9BACT|nr:protein of unknown function [Trichlorobacter ammonificans]
MAAVHTVYIYTNRLAGERHAPQTNQSHHDTVSLKPAQPAGFLFSTECGKFFSMAP